MVDIHTHIIFNVDDGSDTIEESVALIKYAASQGVTDIILTPHFTERYMYNKEKINENYSKLVEVVEKENIELTLHLGNEIAIYGNMAEILESGIARRLANSKYILIEFPMAIDVNYVLDTIYEARLRGIVPIIAHPERCECFRRNAQLISMAVKEGALIQCNTGSIMGEYGNTAKGIVKRLLQENLIHFFATDTHRKNREGYTELKEVQKQVIKLVGEEKASQLFEYNPMKIIKNEDI